MTEKPFGEYCKLNFGSNPSLISVFDFPFSLFQLPSSDTCMIFTINTYFNVLVVCTYLYYSL